MIEMVFGKGSYDISDARAYLGSLRADEGKLYQSVFQVDHERTKGNQIEGTIVAERKGYFITTIPYDENFEILVDEEQAEAEEVNTAFLGFEIEAGEHEVRIVYHAPGVRAGKMMSLMGVLLLGGMMFYSKGHISFHSPGFRFLSNLISSIEIRFKAITQQQTAFNILRICRFLPSVMVILPMTTGWQGRF